MEAYLNELSLEPHAEHVIEARDVMSFLVRSVAAGTRKGAISGLRADSALLTRPLAPSYSVADWLNDGTVDKEEKRLLASVASKLPSVDEVVAQIHGDALVECRCNGQIALGCAAALLLDGPVLSVAKPAWMTDPLTVDLKTVTAHEERDASRDVCNVWSPQCFVRRSEWFSGRLMRRLNTGPQVLAEESRALSHLTFAETARQQLRGMNGSGTEFHHVVRHLVSLNEAAAQWKRGPLTSLLVWPWSPESEATLQRFGAQRQFMCPDGQVRLFSLHSKVNVSAWRIYFYPVGPGRPVIIGYIGPHLDIVSQ